MTLNFILESVIKTEYNVNYTDEASNNSNKSLFDLSNIIQNNQEPIEFNSTDAIFDRKTGQMVCLLCYKGLDPKELPEHMIKIHNYHRVLYKCYKCKSTFLERKLLMVHRDNCEVKEVKKKKRTFQQLLREVESKEFLDSQEEIIFCPLCMIELSKYNLKAHLISVHKKVDESQTCEICDRMFKSKMTLREHVRLVHEAVEDSAQCDMCDQKFKSEKYLQNHKRNVHPKGNKVHLCDICGKEFKSHLSLHQHTKQVHPLPSAAVDCPHCSQTFKCTMNLRQHIRVSHGIGPQSQAKSL